MLFFCDLNISPSPGYLPENQNFSKTKKFRWRNCLNLYQKISKNKGDSFEQKIPPAYVPQICQKTKVIPLNKPPPPSRHTYPKSVDFTANLSKKIHAKNLKIFFKKLFLKKTCFWGTKKGVLGGGKFPGKNV